MNNEQREEERIIDAGGDGRPPERERTIWAAPRGAFVGFLDFIRERAVVGLAIGFVLGGAVSKVTTSFSTDIVNPALIYLFGGTQRLSDVMLGEIAIGKFIATILDFLILALTVYLIFKILKLDRLDKKKEG